MKQTSAAERSAQPASMRGLPAARWRWIVAGVLALILAFSVYFEFLVLLPGVRTATESYAEALPFAGWGVFSLVLIAALLQVTLVALIWGQLSPGSARRIPGWATVGHACAVAAIVAVAVALMWLGGLGFLPAGVFIMLVAVALVTLVFLVISVVYWASRR